MVITIRKATLADVPELLQLIANEANNLRPLPSPERLRKWILAGEVIFFMGVMIISRHHPKAVTYGPYRYPKDSVYLSHIASQTKGKGFGKRVLISFIRSMTNPIFLNVFADNLPARALYEKVGFRLQGIHTFNGKEVAYYVIPPRIAK